MFKKLPHRSRPLGLRVGVYAVFDDVVIASEYHAGELAKWRELGALSSFMERVNQPNRGAETEIVDQSPFSHLAVNIVDLGTNAILFSSGTITDRVFTSFYE